MRVKLDENMTAALKPLLAEAGHEVETVTDEGMTGAGDSELIDACRREGRLLITFDVGFGDLRAYRPQTHAGIILMRLSDQQPAVTLDVVSRVLQQHDLSSFAGALVVVTEDSIRIRRE